MTVAWNDIVILAEMIATEAIKKKPNVKKIDWLIDALSGVLDVLDPATGDDLPRKYPQEAK